MGRDLIPVFGDVLTNIDNAAFELLFLGDANVERAVEKLRELVDIASVNIVTGTEARANATQVARDVTAARAELIAAVRAPSTQTPADARTPSPAQTPLQSRAV
jgi:hypothetical protein